MNKFAFLIRCFAFIILIGIFVIAPFSYTWKLALILAQSFLLASILLFIAMILDNRRGGISYMFEFFMLFFIALPATMQISNNTFPWFAVLQPTYICWAFSLLALSQMAYQMGAAFQEFKNSNTISRASSLQLSPKDSLFYSKWAWSLAIVAILFAIIAGPSNLLVARIETVGKSFEGLTLQFMFMCRSLSLLAMVMLLFLIKFTHNPKLRKQNFYAVFLFLLPFMAINYLPALPRFILFGIFLALSTSFVNYFRPKNKAMVAFASIAILFVVFPTIKSLGRGELNLTGAMQRTDTSSITSYLLRVDFDAFMQIVSTVQYFVQNVDPIRYGQNFIGVALFFIPRGIWAGKPIDTGEIVSTGLGYQYTNVSSPLPAEALMGFGIIGPVIIFFLLAFYISKIEWQVKPHKNAIPVASSFFIYAIFMGFIVIIMRGALNGVAPQFATAFLAFFVMQFIKNQKFVSKKRPKR
ncbi:hypothetical protein L0668_17360 [Paraglaciecola aquimarina]|uniref:Oligosaccharide repeat unit polymerase n=1 Tax=Paraglaciecola algarum TaxID=3050085 RepID=A0ABS9DAA9_9ALTE|nr:hypothetical protein [Paraglaciecola sp. G1-23]MCF2949891.1 hypothetical protein [Paraglaciecola sp. G1-23]